MAAVAPSEPAAKRLRTEAPAAVSQGNAAALAAVLAGLATQRFDKKRDGAHAIFVDLTRLPFASYVASRSRLASNSVFFAGLLGDEAAMGAPAAYAVCAEGAEPCGLRRLPLSVPAAFQWLLPFLDSGDLGFLRALRKQLNCNDACGLLGCALFLGLSTSAIDVIITEVLVPPDHGDFDFRLSLACAENFRPDILPPEAMESVLAAFEEREFATPCELAEAVLRWAHRGGWGVAQSARLQQLLDAVAPPAKLSAETFCTLAKMDALRELLVIAFPSLTCKHLLNFQKELHSARGRIADLEPKRKGGKGTKRTPQDRNIKTPIKKVEYDDSGSSDFI